METHLKTNRSTLANRGKLTTNAATRYYGVLVKCCGASPRKLEKETFIYHFAVCSNAEAEYVFQNRHGEYWKFISEDRSGISVQLHKDNKTTSDVETEIRVNMILRGLRSKIDVEMRTSEGLTFRRK